MRLQLSVLLLLSGCAWVTDAELEGYEEDCDCSEGGLVYYPDDDGDGYGDLGEATTCPPTDDWINVGEDCDDSNPDIHPEAEESCNGHDDDCDGEVDGDNAMDAWRWYQDADEDGYGDPAIWRTACEQPSGWVHEDDATDCDDEDPGTNPDAVEICGDLVDNDCDGEPGNCRMEGTQTWTHAGLRVHGSSSGDGTGGSMAGGWDLVGDGYADVAIGVDAWDGRATGGGAVMLFAGPGDDGDVDLDAATVMIEAYEADLGAGFSLAMLGDHDGGGEPWIAVGCHSTASSSAGRIYLLEGPFIESSIDLQANAEVSLEFAEPGDNVGQAVAGGLDATGNGYTDLVVSATGAADGDGEVLVFEGPVSAFATRETALGVIAGASDDDMLGLDVDLVPDVDGDGLADLLIGAATAGSGFHGEVQLFLSPLAEGISQDDASERYQGESENALMYRADAAGDVDGDGRGDMILGAPFQGKEAEGKAYLLLGATNPVSTLAGAEATFVGSVAGAILGNAVVGLEDFDADGYGDLLLGAPGVDAPDADSGACYLFHGPLQGALESASADATLQGPGVGASAGVYMSSAGDIDGDGRSDALIGAPGGELGQVALLHGEGW